jgi:sporulation protein YlmC with PRC-barrel domain
VALAISVCFLQGSQTRHSGPLQKHRVSHLMGMTVESSDGQKVGRIRNFIVDEQTGELPFAILSAGGFLGMGAKVKIVPAEAMSLGTTKKGVLALHTTAFHWKQAPDFRKSDLASLGHADWAAYIYEFYGLQPNQGIQTAQPATAGAKLASLAPTGPQAGNAAPQKRAVRKKRSADPMQLASDIIGQNVVNRQQENVGEISDLLLDLSERKPALAIISGGRLLKKDGSFAVPLRSLTLTDRGKAEIDAGAAMFEQAPPFDEQAWQSAASSSNRMIYRFEP